MSANNSTMSSNHTVSSNQTAALNQDSQLTEHGVLGAITNYPSRYDASILYPIARTLGRDKITQNTASINAQQLAVGVDWWHCFEISWLNQQGISQVAMARLSIPADSINIVESKSLKLYLNSFNLTTFSSVDKVSATIVNDLNALLETQVQVEFFTCQHELQDTNKQVTTTEALTTEKVNNLNISKAQGQCIDGALDNTDKVIAISEEVTASVLTLSGKNINDHSDEVCKSSESVAVKQCYHSHLLRSNCPVTNQPDWGTVEIDIECPQIDTASLLEYILSYRQHNGFHEQCVEQIFADLTEKFQPKQLMVRAWYTRRGGIDINPCRVSHEKLLPQASRLIRQ